MKLWLIIVIILAAPSLVLASADIDKQTHKKSKHHKTSHKTKVSSHHQTKSRYKLVAYKKNGKLRHRYVDTHPEKIAPPDNLYPEATPSLPVLETQFTPNHAPKEHAIDLGNERTPTSEKQETISYDDSKEAFPPPEMNE